MKVTTVVLVAVVGLAAILVPQAEARSAMVDRVSSALEESFSSLSAKRSEWFENYSTMNNLTQAATTQLKELGTVSKMALPLMWYLYQMTVHKQKGNYPKVVEVGEQTLPFHAETAIADSTLGFNFYLEATFLLENYRDFQVKIKRDDVVIFFLNVYFDERRAVMGNIYDQVTEKIVLEGDNFPAIQLYQPFRVNVLVMTDCMVTSFWLNNLDLSSPQPLPGKHFWCSRDYAYGKAFSFDIDTLNGEENHQHHDSHEEHEQASEEDEQASQEDEQESQEDSHDAQSNEIKLVSAVLYNGFIYQ